MYKPSIKAVRVSLVIIIETLQEIIDLKNVKLKLTEKLEASELNIIDVLMLIDYSIASLTEMNKDDISIYQ
ncbi:Uncharacterized protein FWK35_00009158 [Aphis craccivora]|uniref:Zinc finger MYM-type protein 1-like n=1 Tax=Aphis craccivora TaxID=307492 RepID=A0A6G0Y7W7_APHCR|nr:Uncharacterized protein FWK35_00009158 [Aphis craccivora]